MKTDEEIIEDKKERFKFKLKTFLYYIIVYPFTEKITKITLSLLSTISLVFIFISLVLRNLTFIWIFLLIWIILNVIKEWKSGEFIYWYNQRKYRKRNEALKKAREEKRAKFINE